MGGADQAASEESAGAQLLRKTGERGREVASSGGNMLCRAPGRKAAARRAHRLGGQQEHAFSGHGGPPARQLKEKSPGRPRTQQGAAHGPRAGKPTVKAERQPIKTPRAIHAATRQTACAVKQAARRAKQAARVAQKTARVAERALANTAKACIAAAKSLVAALAAGSGFALCIVLLICLIALVAGSAFGIFFRPNRPEKG